MPDAAGRIRGIVVPAEAWERVFGAGMHAHDHDWPTCEHRKAKLDEDYVWVCADCGRDCG